MDKSLPDDFDPYGGRMTGPVQVINPSSQPGTFFWKVLASVAASLITMAIGFLGGATWSHNTRITALETYRESDKENLGKLETRVDKLESRRHP